MSSDIYPTRAIATSQAAMAATPHYLASKVGLTMLKRQGSAVDAAIAANAALGVVYPHLTGIGGDAFGLIYHRASQTLLGLNGSGRVSAQATPDVYRQRQLSVIPQRGPLAAITVPGAVAAWKLAHHRLGRLPWAEILQPAIELAETGYPLSISQHNWTQKDARLLMEFSGLHNPFLPEGTLPAPQQTVHNPGLANTLKQLAKSGPDSFYQGQIADRLIQYLGSLGSPLSAQDFANAEAQWVDPIETTYHSHRICELPPNSQGFTLLQMLNLIEPFNLTAIGHNSADYYHLMVEVAKLAFADRDRWLGDPDFVDIPIQELISKPYSDLRRARIAMGVAQTQAAKAIGGDTTYSAFIDAEGNAVSWIQSLYFDYGSAVVPSGTGIVLQNRGAIFSLEPGQVNTLTPGKRPFHTLMPAMALHPDGRLHTVFGTMGGEGQPQIQLALLTRLIDYGFDPQTAIDLPRWMWGRTWGKPSTTLKLEKRVSKAVRVELANRGHDVQVVPEWSELMGHASLITVDPETGELRGGCDPRSDGAALGL